MGPRVEPGLGLAATSQRFSMWDVTAEKLEFRTRTLARRRHPLRVGFPEYRVAFRLGVRLNDA